MKRSICLLLLLTLSCTTPRRFQPVVQTRPGYWYYEYRWPYQCYRYWGTGYPILRRVIVDTKDPVPKEALNYEKLFEEAVERVATLEEKLSVTQANEAATLEENARLGAVNETLERRLEVVRTNRNDIFEENKKLTTRVRELASELEGREDAWHEVVHQLKTRVEELEKEAEISAAAWKGAGTIADNVIAGLRKELSNQFERIDNLAKWIEARVLGSRLQVGWYSPADQRFCYSDVKESIPERHKGYTVPVYAHLDDAIDKLKQKIMKLEGSKDHPEHYCHFCGGMNINWYADNELWTKVMDDPDVICCPLCFVKEAEKKGITCTAWRLCREDDAPGVDVLRLEVVNLKEEIEEYKKLPASVICPKCDHVIKVVPPIGGDKCQQ